MRGRREGGRKGERGGMGRVEGGISCFGARKPQKRTRAETSYLHTHLSNFLCHPVYFQNYSKLTLLFHFILLTIM